jgi:cytochrome c oxidase subunit IV
MGKTRVRDYLTVWASLLVLTAVTVAAAGLDLGRVAIVIVLAVAATKSSLVLLYFMHLREERLMVIKVLVPVVIALLAIFIGLTYTDVLYRRGG